MFRSKSNLYFTQVKEQKTLPRAIIFGRRHKAIYHIVTAPKSVTPEIHLQIWDSSATLIGQLATVTIFGAGVRWSITFWLLSFTVTAFWRDLQRFLPSREQRLSNIFQAVRNMFETFALPNDQKSNAIFLQLNHAACWSCEITSYIHTYARDHNPSHLGHHILIHSVAMTTPTVQKNMIVP